MNYLRVQSQDLAETRSIPYKFASINSLINTK